jgi:hypothetical protein
MRLNGTYIAGPGRANTKPVWKVGDNADDFVEIVVQEADLPAQWILAMEVHLGRRFVDERAPHAAIGAIQVPPSVQGNVHQGVVAGADGTQADFRTLG